MAVTGAAQQILATLTAWPGVEALPHRFGGTEYRLGPREIGHLHGDHAAHFFFPKDVWAQLRSAGRITDHPVFPGREGPAARRIAGQSDVDDVIEMMRVNYDRLAAKTAA